MIEIFEIQEADEAILTSVNRLLPQLSKSARPINGEKWKRLVESECTRLFFAKEGTDVLGMLSLVVFPIPTGVKAWIEDVVVDKKERGKGIGKLLIEHLINFSKSKSCDKIILNSKESNIPFYNKLGFVQNEIQMIIRD